MLQSSNRRSEMVLGYTSVMPVIIVIFVVIGIPFINALYLSLTDKTVGAEAHFIGFGNYREIFTDPVYWKVLKNTFIYFMTDVFFKLVIGMIFALTLNQAFFGRSIVRVLFLVPWAISGLVSALTWKWMYNDSYGIINQLLLDSGLIDIPVAWLSGPKIALVSVIIVNIWRGIPFFLFSILGGLQTIDRQMYEAAKIDGAGPIRQFFSVTIPSISSVLVITTMLSSIWTFNDFENIFLITGGGPLYNSAVISVYTYETAFLQNNMGKSLSVAGSIIPILLVLMFFMTRKLAKED
ncbi:sugar ABC transporter permease [Paenibacillus alginolyticus]|uniref:Sugar ABC transporter permease n=1 Tax=Paenibacillus alginolyticus TaxID=59839 RepID=A0ABT4G5V3_9BACL|nr:sugar ABC transporter permease [Paenibacillus alginolyticus]MCY9668536.1 sugar ABC transporter permease [Paenibacillus alginolyticus]MCY9691552.1 sugar ABC transporter permease [Paenibacillus alginolyticus]MEC0147012.1 sugar ABC transporter permease [Paenibacillus alginolyticus]